jgi:hypothetical protein
MPESKGDTLLVRCKCGNPMRVSRQFIGKPMTCYTCGRAFVVGGPKPQAQAGGAGAGAGGAGGAAGSGGGGAGGERSMVPSPAVSPPLPAAAPPAAPPQQPVVYIVQNPPAAVPPQTIFVAPPHVTATHNVHVGSPVPRAEETIWEGRSSLAYHLPGMIWSGVWGVAWIGLASSASRISAWLLESARAAAPDAPDAVAAILLNPAYVAAFFLVLAAWAGWRLARRVLLYLNTYYVFTTQRLRLRQGIFSREMNQMELFRVKDFSVVEPLWGRLTGYAHVRVVSADRLAGDVVLLALPGGVKTMDTMRLAAQSARSETGITAIRE